MSHMSSFFFKSLIFNPTPIYIFKKTEYFLGNFYCVNVQQIKFKLNKTNSLFRLQPMLEYRL